MIVQYLAKLENTWFSGRLLLFNHESPRRGEIFVTRKIMRAAANMAKGLDKCL